MALTEQQLALIDENPFVGVVTDVRPDGSLHSTVVWVDVVDGHVGFNTAVGRAKERYLRNDPRVSLVVVDPADTHKWVSISGRAEFVEEGADAQIDKLAKKYLGARHVSVPQGDGDADRRPDRRRACRLAPGSSSGYRAASSTSFAARIPSAAPPSMKPWKSVEQCSPAKWMLPCGAAS